MGVNNKGDMTKPILKGLLGLSLTTFSLMAADEKVAPATKPAVPPAGGIIATPPAGITNAGGFTNEKDQVSYSIGMNIGSNFKKQGIDINPDVLIMAIRDTTTGDKTRLTEKEMMDTLNGYQAQMMARKADKAKVVGEKNRVDGVKFLEENKKKADVKSTASGLQYKVLTAGAGATPTATDTVKTHYRGTLIDGTEFDSSYKRGEPATFPVNGVIKGWTEALQLMKVGSKWQLFIPSALAYGERGAGADIGPDAVLIFDIELLDIVKQ